MENESKPLDQHPQPKIDILKMMELHPTWEQKVVKLLEEHSKLLMDIANTLLDIRDRKAPQAQQPQQQVGKRK